MLRATDVFKPNGVPKETYVERQANRLEQLLRDAFDIENFVVSVAGPSKTGKTVLITKTVDPDNLIQVSGASIQDPTDVWKHVLSWMESPTDIVHSTSKSTTIGAEGGGQGDISIPFLGKIGAQGSISSSRESTDSTSSSIQSNYFSQVVREIGGSDFVVFLDDFHYIPNQIQSEVARQIKSISERGVKICTASVPHRADDVVRSNPELRGRFAAVDTGYWTGQDLTKIASQGFTALNIQVAKKDIDRLATEAFGSPQLMQTLCLNLCFETDARERVEAKREVDIPTDTMENVLVRSSMFADYSTLVENLHAGPKERGTERKSFQFSDESRGDVYRSVLLALSRDPVAQSFRYDEVLSRVREVCIGETPVGSSIAASLQQMQKIAKKIAPESDILEWDEDVLNIVEPYFLFYIRCSDKLLSLGSR